MINAEQLKPADVFDHQILDSSEFKELTKKTQDGIYVYLGHTDADKALLNKLLLNPEDYKRSVYDSLKGFNNYFDYNCSQFITTISKSSRSLYLLNIYAKLDAESGFTDKDRFNEVYYQALESGLKLSSSLWYYVRSKHLKRLAKQAKVNCLVLGTTLPENQEALDKFFKRHKINVEIFFVDYNFMPLENCRKSSSEQHYHIQADIENLPFEKESFDLVIGDFVEFCLSPEKIPDFLSSVKRMMTKDGAAFISNRFANKPCYGAYRVVKIKFPDGIKCFFRTNFSTYKEQLKLNNLRFKINYSERTTDGDFAYYLTLTN